MLRIVTAFAAEAAPLIKHYRLRPEQPAGLLPLYTNAAPSQSTGMNTPPTCALVLSGVGTTAAAAASAYLHRASGEQPYCVWLNIGIAGHTRQTPGALLLASKIIDHISGDCWYPPQIVQHNLACETLITVPEPERKYPQTAMYDMEASGFYTIASRCTAMELTQCIKVISDNPDTALPTRQQVGDFIAAHCATIDDYAEQLLAHAHALQQRHAEPPEYSGFVQHWRFSVTQQHRLRRLLQRWRTLSPDSDCDPDQLRHCRTAAAVLDALQSTLDQVATAKR